MLTGATPMPFMPITPAAADERSMMRPLMKGTTVVDGHRDGAAVDLVGHENARAEGQRAMGSRHGVRLKRTARSRHLALPV